VAGAPTEARSSATLMQGALVQEHRHLTRVNPDGSRQQFRVSGEPMFGRSGQFIGYRGVGVETTPQGQGRVGAPAGA